MIEFIKNLGLFPSFLLLFLQIGCAQIPTNRPKLTNPAFDRKLQQLLRFSVPLIGVQELQNIQNEVYIFDTRMQAEFEVSHIPGARYLGYEDFDEKRLQDVSKDAKIVLYCSVGYRSEKIGEQLTKLGYTQVYNLYGSIFEWANQGYPIVDAQGKPVKKVHTYNKAWSKWLEEDAAQKVW